MKQINLWGSTQKVDKNFLIRIHPPTSFPRFFTFLATTRAVWGRWWEEIEFEIFKEKLLEEKFGKDIEWWEEIEVELFVEKRKKIGESW